MACALVCAVVAAAGFAATRSDRLSTSPAKEELEADLGGATVLATADAGAARPKEAGRREAPSPTLATVERGSLQVRVSNHYQLGENATTDLSLYPWEHVAEPYRPTRLELTRVPHNVEDGAKIT